MECPSPTDRSECAMMRERSVAGLSDDIPSCPIHGKWSDEDMDMRGCGVDEIRVERSGRRSDMPKPSRIQQLIAAGFDESTHVPFTKRWRVRCSQCEALVINGIPSHETRCPNIPRETDDEGEDY